MTKKVILTGIRSNEEPTLGNYLGAFLPMVELQSRHAGQFQVNMFVPDLHSFTTPIDHEVLYQRTHNNLKLFIAAGLDIHNPDTFIYRQSFIPAHSELAWILSCFAYFGELSRMTQFKEKSQNQQNENAGLFNYPVLMAADILLYGATYVPLGDDQKQHLELTRDLAIRMNNKFGDLFTVPEQWKQQLAFSGRDNGIRIRSLRNPQKKMSKSVDDPAGTILLSDNPDEAAKKIMSATTDSEGIIKLDWQKQPGISNLLQMSALLSAKPLQDVVNEWEGKTTYGDLKTTVAEQVKSFLTDLTNKLSQVDQQQLQQKLEQDETAVRQIADTTLYRVQQAVGLRPR